MTFEANSTNPTADLLRSALALIAQPERWCRKAYARNARGKKVYSVSPTVAARWCAEGACMYAGAGDCIARLAARDKLVLAIGDSNIARWNDAPERTHAEVVAAFRRAIAITEGGA